MMRIISILVLFFGAQTTTKYYHVPVGFKSAMDGRVAVYEGMRFEFEASIDTMGRYMTGEQCRFYFPSAFDSLAQGYYGQWDSTVYYLTREDFGK